MTLLNNFLNHFIIDIKLDWTEISQTKYKSWCVIYRFSRLDKKLATINPISISDNKCFQYATALALNRKEIGKHPERITKIKLFLDKYEWERINYPSEKDN